MPRTVPVALLLLAGAALAQSAPAEPQAETARRAVVALRAAEPDPWFGVRVAPLDTETRKTFEIAADVKAGVVVIEVFENSPASRAGLRAGDVVTTFCEKAVTDAAGLVEAVRGRKPNEMVSYVVRRGTGTIAGTCRLGERPREEIEETVVETEVRPVPVPKEDLERRAAELREQVQALRERMQHLKAETGTPRPGWDVWIDREERALVQARKDRDPARVMVHQVRLDLLRELRDSGSAAPPPPPDAGLRRLERKLDRILELLEQRRPAGARSR